MKNPFERVKQWLSPPEAKQGPIIELPTNPSLRQRLEIKLNEYRARLIDQQKAATAYDAPEVILTNTADTRYKIAVLEKLLADGKVDTFALSRELSARDSVFTVDAFDNACRVIEDYCKTGGKHSVGGTGLSPEQTHSGEKTRKGVEWVNLVAQDTDAKMRERRAMVLKTAFGQQAPMQLMTAAEFLNVLEQGLGQKVIPLDALQAIKEQLREQA